MTADVAPKTTGPRHRRATRPVGPTRLVVVLLALVGAVVLALVVAFLAGGGASAAWSPGEAFVEIAPSLS